MKFDLVVHFVDGEYKHFYKINYPQCSNTTQVREWFNKAIRFMNIGKVIVNVNNINYMTVTESEHREFDEKVQQYREKNPHFPLEEK